MKRASFDLHQSDKHQTLLQEFLELQKEFVSKKRKLQAAKENRDTLMAEIRFLRGRRKYLLKTQSPQPEQAKDNTIHLGDIQRKKDAGRMYSGNEAALDHRYPFFGSHSNSRDKEGKGDGEEQAVTEAYRAVEKKSTGNLINDKSIKKKSSKSFLIDDKRLGKKKISWQDSVTLKV